MHKQQANRRGPSVTAITALVGLMMLCTGIGTAMTPASIRAAARSQAETSATAGGQVCLGPLLQQMMPNAKVLASRMEAFGGIKGNISLVVGGRNFTAADVDQAEVPFYTVNGVGLTPLLHDGGEWPGTNGNTATDDGRTSFGNDWAGEFYDLDRNGHYPKAVLRYIGTHCYIFVPPMFFPTLPRSISTTEEVTPAPESAWGMFWEDTASWGDGPYYYAVATGAKTLDPRFVLGADKNLARLKLKEFADEFDGVIYPKMREYFGTEPDIDGDSKIFILLDDIRDGVGSFRGYFWSANQYPRSVISTSNEKELIYLDMFPTYVMQPQTGYGTVAHEFVHMIHFNEGTQVVDGQLEEEERWLEEGFTQYGQYIYNKQHTSNVDEFIKKPDTILVEPRLDVWLGNNPFANYGASYLFVFYIMEHFGQGNGAAFMRNWFRDKTKGIISVDNALRTFSSSMADAFADWAIANYLDKTRKLDQSAFNDGKWGYFIDNDFDVTNNIGVNQSLPVKYSEKVLLGTTGAARTSKVNSWAADYIEISGNTGNVNLAFDGDDRGQFKCAVIKRGPSVDPSVEFFYLNDRQAGNLVVQSYGAGSTYENLVLVPMVVGNANYELMNYVYSATFHDLKVAIFPNPVFENFLHIVVRTTDVFSSEPRLQMTYNGQQGYLVMSPVNKSTYIANYPLTTSGEGQIEANGTTSAGTILTNKLKFSAVYYPPKSSGLLTASIARLNVPAGALPRGGVVVVAGGERQTSHPGLQRMSATVEVGLPMEKTDQPLTMTLPMHGPVALAQNGLALFEETPTGVSHVGPAAIVEGGVQALISRSGSYFIAADTAAPVIGQELANVGPGRIEFPIQDLGAGIDPESLVVAYGGRRLAATYDSRLGKAGVFLGALLDGSYDLQVSVADLTGNVVQGTIRAQVAGAFGVAQAIAFPSPARHGTTLRMALTGAGNAGLSVEAIVRDMAGDEVISLRLPHKGGGLYETPWNLVAANGNHVANGAYIIEFRAQGNGADMKERRKFAVLR